MKTRINRMLYGILFLMSLFQLTVATEFKISNQSSSDRVRVALASGRVMPKWSGVIERLRQISGSSGLRQLIGIWVEYSKKGSTGFDYYYKDVSDLKIPVAKLGVPIAIGDNGTVVIGNQVVELGQRDAVSVHNYVNP